MGSRYIRASNRSSTHQLLHRPTHTFNTINSIFVPIPYNSFSSPREYTAQSYVGRPVMLLSLTLGFSIAAFGTECVLGAAESV